MLFFTFITCNDVSSLPYAWFGCVITFTNLQLCSSFVINSCDVRAIRKQQQQQQKKKKKEEKVLLYFTQESKPLHHGQSSRQMLLFLIDNVAFAKENTNKTYEAVKNWSLAAPNMASLATDTENQTNNYDQDQESSFCKAKKQKQQTNKRTLNSKHFLQHQHTRGLQRRHTSTTTKTCVACGISPDMRVNTRYINSTRGTASKRSTARLDLSVVDGKVKENGELEEKRNSPARST